MIGPLVGAGAAAGAPLPLGDPPSGDPSDASAYSYGGGLTGVQWVNGDSSAHTGVARTGSSSTEPTSADFFADPGETSLETGQTEQEHWWVAHFKNSQYGNWVQAPFGL